MSDAVQWVLNCLPAFVPKLVTEPKILRTLMTDKGLIMTSGIILTVLSIAGVEEGIVKAVFGSDITALLCTWHLLERNSSPPPRHLDVYDVTAAHMSHIFNPYLKLLSQL